MANQQHIQIGIDLGTTNSSVAININGIIEIVKKPGGVEYTPSIFGFDKGKNKVVGQKAYENYYKDASEEEIIDTLYQVIGSYATGSGTANGTNTGDETDATIDSIVLATTDTTSNLDGDYFPFSKTTGPGATGLKRISYLNLKQSLL